MASASNSSNGSSSSGWVAVVLAAGYGSRLQQGILSDPTQQFAHLVHTPKALLPVGGVPLMDHWIRAFRSGRNPPVDEVFIVTNQQFYGQFCQWATTRGIAMDNIVNDGTTSNETRLGAAADLALVLDAKAPAIGDRNILVVAGDTLFFRDFDLSAFLNRLPPQSGGVVYYDVADPEETKKRGIIEVDEATGLVLRLLEKPDPAETTSRKACPAFYAYRNSTLPLVRQFIDEHKDLPLDERDAPGKLLAWLIPGTPIQATHVSGRFDIGNLTQYKDTLAHFSMVLDQQLRALQAEIIETTCARVGFLGNPSDGFNGKTLSFTMSNFYATITLRASEELTLVPHPEFDRHVFRSLDDLAYVTETRGYYGGERLLRATCKKFAHLCTHAGLTIHLQRNFTMSYDTNIPRMVGMAGSSAIVSAALRALMRFYGISAEDLNIDKAALPQVVLDIEVSELGISAGLQDRVIQIYGGLVHMDFTPATLAANAMKHGTYTELDCDLLPPLYLAYDARVGKESGKTHSTVRQRWAERDPELVQGMSDIADLADQAVEALRTKNFGRLAELMEKNFATRRRLYGDKVVGAKNVRLAEAAAAHGLAAKFTGSGGAFVCLKKVPAGDGADANACALSPEEEERVRDAFSREGFELERIKPTAAGCPSHITTPNEGVVQGMVLQID